MHDAIRPHFMHEHHVTDMCMPYCALGAPGVSGGAGGGARGGAARVHGPPGGVHRAPVSRLPAVLQPMPVAAGGQAPPHSSTHQPQRRHGPAPSCSCAAVDRSAEAKVHRNTAALRYRVVQLSCCRHTCEGARLASVLSCGEDPGCTSDLHPVGAALQKHRPRWRGRTCRS